MIQIKQEYNTSSGLVAEIYSDKYKLFETKTRTLWNATEKEPIAIIKSRLKDYLETTELLDIEEEKVEEEVVKEENKED